MGLRILYNYNWGIMEVDELSSGRRKVESNSLFEQSFGTSYSAWVHDALDDLPGNFLITDPGLSGHPIVFASRGFLQMSGYIKEEVIGKNGRMFQGPATDRRTVMEIREAIREERCLQINLLNYRKDGTPFWILFHLSPVFSKVDGRVAHFVSVQIPIYGKSTSFQMNKSSIIREAFLGSCRKEICADYVGESGNSLDFNAFVRSDQRVIEAKEPCEASEQDKQKASRVFHNILSILSHYSKLTGRSVTGTMCNLFGIKPFSSSLNISLGRIKQSFVLTDHSLPDMPIVYASDAFLKLTGYTRNQVLGCNCRVLDGPDTDNETLSQIQENINHEKACSVRILNYRKDGTKFWNLLCISPVRNATGKIAFYVWVQIDEASNDGPQGLSPHMIQLATVGAVKVAIRTLPSEPGHSKS